MNKIIFVFLLTVSQCLSHAQQNGFVISMDTDYDEVPTIFKLDETSILSLDIYNKPKGIYLVNLLRDELYNSSVKLLIK